jgi:hypothetical protein
MVWTRLFTTLNVCGALLTVPAAAAGIYTNYHATFSSEASCRALRRAILSALEKEVDAKIKQTLVRKDVAEFEHSCDIGHSESKVLARAISNNDLAANRGDRADTDHIQVPRPPLPGFYRHWLNKKPGMVPMPSPHDPSQPIGS